MPLLSIHLFFLWSDWGNHLRVVPSDQPIGAVGLDEILGAPRVLLSPLEVAFGFLMHAVIQEVLNSPA